MTGMESFPTLHEILNRGRTKEVARLNFAVQRISDRDASSARSHGNQRGAVDKLVSCRR